jgi:hypothetical protein
MAILEGSQSFKSGPQHYAAGVKTHPRQEKINVIIDDLGHLSSKSQGLPVTITTSQKFFTSDNRIYIKVAEGRVIGMIKMGRRRLFI